jgi:hypothetical protein
MSAPLPSLRFARVPEESDVPIPPISVRYFYSSPLAIDDPLAPLPPPSSTANTTFKSAPRPFSNFDNAALEKAWLDVRQRTIKHAEEQRSEKRRSRSGTAGSSNTLSAGGPSLAALRKPPNLGRNKSHGPDSPSASPAIKPRAIPPGEGQGARRRSGSASGDASVAGSYRGGIDPGEGSLPTLEPSSITKNPFIRAPARLEAKGGDAGSRPTSVRPSARPIDSYNWGEDTFLSPDTPRDKSTVRESDTPKPAEASAAKVPVGVSRLHNVTFPEFQMEPIYWSPVGDIAPVIRGTWFYYENLLPVEPEIANLLESGYISLQVWTQTWTDELNSAVEVGAAGESKILHELWPQKTELPPSRPHSVQRSGSVLVENNLDIAATSPEKERQEIAATAGDLIDISTGTSGQDHRAAGTALWGRDGIIREYKTAGVLYANEKDAYILRPNLQPSEYHGRRPLANNIRKNRSVGVRVIRGFDQELWKRLHPVKKSARIKKARQGVSSSNAGISPELRQQVDPALAESERPEVTDLVLVIHGIGQKLSERVESYHFTHAINSFRREMNVELGDESVKMNLRKGMGGIMVLPVCLKCSTFSHYRS